MICHRKKAFSSLSGQRRVAQAFSRLDYTVRNQMPLALDENSEPEPDVAVVPGKARDYTQAHPTTAVLVVEVADATLRLDRKTKQAVYARNGIAEYWIVNLKDNSLEVYRILRAINTAPR